MRLWRCRRRLAKTRPSLLRQKYSRYVQASLLLNLILQRRET